MPGAGRILRELLGEDEFTLIMEAHNALVARICERNGFRALWVSGLCAASTMGLRDNSEATWTELAGVAETIVNTTGLPVLFDGDSGHGNYSNVRRLVRTLSNRGLAGVVIEDKTFPKMNSFIGQRHDLLDAREFQGKIRAAKDTQTTADFMVVARLEGFIAGDGAEAVAERAVAYCDAGADALFVHSRQTDEREIARFFECWSGSVPVIVTPTTYPRVPFARLRDVGAAGAICANQALRAAVRAIDEVTRCIQASDSLAAAEKTIAPISEIFDLLDYRELEEAERLYGGPPQRQPPL